MLVRKEPCQVKSITKIKITISKDPHIKHHAPNERTKGVCIPRSCLTSHGNHAKKSGDSRAGPDCLAGNHHFWWFQRNQAAKETTASSTRQHPRYFDINSRRAECPKILESIYDSNWWSPERHCSFQRVQDCCRNLGRVVKDP